MLLKDTHIDHISNWSLFGDHSGHLVSLSGSHSGHSGVFSDVHYLVVTLVTLVSLSGGHSLMFTLMSLSYGNFFGGHSDHFVVILLCHSFLVTIWCLL